MQKKKEQFLCDDPALFKSRLDKFLCSKRPDFSRAYFQTLIEEGNVKINNKIINKSSVSELGGAHQVLLSRCCC